MDNTTKISPFEFVNAINNRRKDVGGRDVIDRHYVPYLVNHQLSYFPDTIFAANAINMYHSVPKYAQFLFLLNMIRPRQRFSKWVKGVKHEDIEMIAQYYGYTYEHARQICDILTDEQKQQIKTCQQKGGAG